MKSKSKLPTIFYLGIAIGLGSCSGGDHIDPGMDAVGFGNNREALLKAKAANDKYREEAKLAAKEGREMRTDENGGNAEIIRKQAVGLK